jgi:hypothetical protein
MKGILKGSKGNSNPPWSLHIESFWETHFINLPEVKGQVVVYGLHIATPKYQNLPFEST